MRSDALHNFDGGQLLEKPWLLNFEIFHLLLWPATSVKRKPSSEATDMLMKDSFLLEFFSFRVSISSLEVIFKNF